MAEECTEMSSVGTTLNWWDSHTCTASAPTSSSTAFMSAPCPWRHHQNPNSNSSCDDDVSLSTSSFTNASSHSALTADSDNQLWTQLLLNIGNGVELHNTDHDIGENFLDGVSSKSVSAAGIFEPTACSDYLKKMDANGGRNPTWPETFPTFDAPKHANGLIAGDRNFFENLVGTWSIALPSSFPAIGEHDGGLLRRPFTGFNGGNTNGYHGVIDDVNCTRNFADYISFNGRLTKPLMNMNSSNNQGFKSLNLSAEGKKQIHQNHSTARSSGRGSGVINEGKKKRSEESSEIVLKKPKQENSAISSTKAQQPKVKIGDRITALQQIVSPFGKTDTASVLTDTIGYIKFLQEQVQLLSNPYMKTNCYKEAWQRLDRKEVKGDATIDLRSRGLCLVPISCTPQVYRDNTGSDYWTPYRGCFYR